MVDRFLVILQRLAANRETLFEDEGRFLPRERVAFDGVGRVGQFNVVPRAEPKPPATTAAGRRVFLFWL